MLGHKSNAQSHEEIRLLKEPVITVSETSNADRIQIKRLKTDSTVKTSVASESSFESEEIVDDYIKGVDQDQKPTKG